MTDTIRLALIGCGRQMGQNLVPFLQRLQGHQIVACVDDDLTLAHAMQARTGAARAVARVEELDLGAVDAAILAVPPQPSSALTRYLVERGISCFVEKPAGESTVVLAGLNELVRHSTAQVQVGFNFRYAETLQQLHSLTHRIRATPSTVSINFFSRHPETPQWGVENTVEAWLRQNGVHALDLARWFQPAPISKIDVHAIHRDMNHFFATILLRHTDGSLSVLRVGNHTMKFVVEVSVEGADGSTFTAPSLEQVLLEMDAGTPSRALLHSTRNLDHGWARSGFGPELEAFLAACRSREFGSSDRPSIADALEASKICDQVMEQLNFDPVQQIFVIDRAVAVG
ncbi:Gfo/Idh/MocA family oxidoreductase [Sphingomonas sp. HF-S4]|uniref:Gfo/Idh/MocA family oxidoreductase n=1 Tax=Sphingomonas agrestis TaxID=3080540 RepID=A0ABU3YC15_9SPHN|nr:Gfo/Idh/MocA family oxidoreductase [Sphingomonas sp. HF-S4]MDV3458934.1 Gfo/Idh/MocA family oxidoreductase [Sphingomonas sp. HF-S4]